MPEHVEDEDYLFRGIPAKLWNPAENRPSTGVLDTEFLSVDWEKKRTQDEYLAKHPDDGMLKFKAAFPRRLGLKVYHEPELDNDAHCIVEGTKRGSFTNSVKKKPPTDVEIVAAPKLYRSG
jgi:hypothetical protein